MLKSMLFSKKVESVRVDLDHGDLITSPPFSKDELIGSLSKELNSLGYRPEDISKIQFINKDGFLHLEGIACELQETLHLPVAFR